MTKEFKYYIMLDEGGRHVSPGYREDSNVPEDIKANGFLATKAEFEKLLNGYLRDPMTGEFKEIPPYVPTLAELKTAKLAEIDMWTAKKITGGFISSCSGEKVLYDTDRDTQSTMTRARANCEGQRFTKEFPNGLGVRGYRVLGGIVSDKKEVFMFSPAQIIKWDEDFAVFLAACKQQGWIKQAQVESSNTLEDILRIETENELEVLGELPQLELEVTNG